ncbi:MAG: DNA topoisomerase III [Bacillota bacterium]|nr:DNA topoisomerase III [Bacillota bacterium]
MKSLILAEKPSVAREIARVLKCTQNNKGYLEGPNYVVTWALGHLVTLAEPDEYDAKLKQWRMEDLPMLPDRMKIKVIKQTSHQYQVVHKLMERNDIKDLVIATDAGREGELVARWIMEKSRWKKPFKRLWISSQTDAAIREGFAKLRNGNEYNCLYDAAVCRAEADWLIGLNVTRALTCRFNAQLSAGRVQTPTLSMIVQREEEIKNFKPVDYWTIRADFGDYFGDWRDGKNQSRIYDLTRAQEIVTKLDGKSGKIQDVKTETRTEPAPLAYDLTELQRDGNRRFAWSAQKTLSVLQDLYEKHKLVTYPRTDSRHITKDIVPTLPARLKGMNAGPYQKLVQPLLQSRPNPGKRFVNDSLVSDHHAIIPTEQPLNLNKLDPDEKKLYDLIARRFLAVLYPPFRYDQTTIITIINGERFFSRGKVVLAQGWREVEGRAPDKDDTKSTEDHLPDQSLSMQKKGAKKQVAGCKLNRSKTTPPPRYTEATLLTAMEGAGKFVDDEDLQQALKGSGLGTPATRAEIIEKLFNTFYIERKGKQIVPTDKGKQVIKLAPQELRSPELTARWEQQLSEIAKGKGSRKTFVTGIRRSAAEMVQTIALDDAEFKHTNLSKKKCPNCGKSLLVVNAKKGKMLVCQDRNCCYREFEQKDEDVFKRSRQSRGRDQSLVRKYSDNEEITSNLGELLKAALEEKNKK